MKYIHKISILIFLFVTIPVLLLAQFVEDSYYWAKTYSAYDSTYTWDDIGWSVKEVPDDMYGGHGYVIAGHTKPHSSSSLFNRIAISRSIASTDNACLILSSFLRYFLIKTKASSLLIIISF